MKRHITAILLLAATWVRATPTITQNSLPASKTAGDPAWIWSHGTVIGLPLPALLMPVICLAMLLGLAGLRWAWLRFSPQNAVLKTTPDRVKTPPAILDAGGATTFCALFCKKYNCSPTEFIERVLWRCLKPQARLGAIFIWWMRHEFFLEDVEMIQHVKDLSDPRNMAYEVNTFRYYNGFRPRKLMKAVLRDVFGIRVSGQRLMDLCQKLYSQVDGHPTPNN